MIRKTAQYEEATQLRKRGFTYSEVAKIVGVAKSTVSSWFSDKDWSIGIRNDNKKRAARDNSKRISLLNTARGTQHRKQYADAERAAITEFKHYKTNPLFMAGLMLYLGHGDTTGEGSIRLSSTKSEIHRIFITFSSEFLGVSREKVRFWLLLYPTHNPERCSRLWSKKIKIPIARFHKYQVIQTKIVKQTLHDGVGNTIIGSTVLKKKLMKWIELVLKDL